MLSGRFVVADTLRLPDSRLQYKGGLAARKLVIIFTCPSILLSVAASLAGVLSHGHDRYRTVTTPRGETVEVQDTGVYRYSVRALVTGGTPWDFVRLLVGIPLILVSFVLYLRGSLRGTVLWTLVFVLAGADRARVREAIGESFPTLRDEAISAR